MLERGTGMPGVVDAEDTRPSMPMRQVADLWIVAVDDETGVR